MARSNRNKPDVQRLLNQFAAEEEGVSAPPVSGAGRGGKPVRVRIGGVVCRISIEPADFVGWGVFQAQSHTRADLAREATLAERRSYLNLFPLMRLILCERARDAWLASAANFGDDRMRLDGLAPVLLAEEVRLFDQVCARYDGTSFWFDDIDGQHDPASSSYLRGELDNRTPPDRLRRKGLTAEQRAAYEVHYLRHVQPPAVDDQVEARRNAPHRPRRSATPQPDDTAQRLQDTLSHAGARLVDYLEHNDSFRVTYSIGGRRYVSSVDKSNLTVQAAGICLSGEDAKFDLASLVGVIREGEQAHDIHDMD